MRRREVLGAVLAASFGIFTASSAKSQGGRSDSARVLTIGLDPRRQGIVDPNLTPTAVLDGVQRDAARMAELRIAREEAIGSADDILEAARAKLEGSNFDVVVIGAGIRLPPANLVLFEPMVNLVHELAPSARIAFNTRPDDSTDAILRWLPKGG